MAAPAPGPTPEDPSTDEGESERRSAKPLVWLLLLIALLAILWYAYSEREPAPGQPGADTAVVEEAADAGEPADAPIEEEAAPPEPASRPVPDPAPPSDRGAEPLAQVEPVYPAAALRSREEGTVLLRVEVDAGGLPVSVDIERSSRSRELDAAARDAVSQWTFRPAIENGQPVPSTVTVPVDFRVE